MKTLLYANSPEKAREIHRWVQALAPLQKLEVAVQRIAGSGPAEMEAARLLQESLRSVPNIELFEVDAREGSPEQAIADQAVEGDYQLVLLAPAGRKGFIRLFYGSMVAHVVRRVSRSVLVVRPSGAVPPRKVLVCVSGSRHSLTNVTSAAHLASLFHAELSILTVVSQIAVDQEGPETADPSSESFLQSSHPLAGHLRVAAEIARKLGVEPKVIARQGLVGEEIVEELETGGYEMLVLGTHRSEEFDTVYEDITDELVQSSPVSTLVVGLRAVLF